LKKIAKFIFMVHPPEEKDLFRIPQLRFLKHLPKGIPERLVGGLGPFPLFKIKGIETTDGKKAEGWVLGLLSTPKLMLQKKPEKTYKLLVKASKWGQKYGAKIMGLGAFTSVVGDAGVTVSERSPISVTTGNSLTVAATIQSVERILELAKKEISNEKIAIVGATGSIGKAVARLLAKKNAKLILISKTKKKLKMLAGELGGSVVSFGTDSDLLKDSKLIIGATSSAGKAIPVDKLNSGSVVIDIALPPDLSKEEAAKRIDCLVLESGEILLPGNPEFSYDWPLPKNIAYACEAETILISLTDSFELSTLGREIDITKVEQIWKLAEKNGFKWAGFRSFSQDLSEENVLNFLSKNDF
tara:strand:+ start:1392 stop:2462 length:1071 start_codon:yes stop_codon:yes gene_type:complete